MQKQGMTAYASPYPSTYDYRTFDDYYSSTGYDQMESDSRNQIAAQTDRAVNQLGAQKQTVQQDADELARQAYISYLQSKGDLPQQMAATGYNGGLSETNQVRLEADWQDRRNSIDRNRRNALNSLDMAISDARLSGDTELSRQLSALKMQAQNQWASLQERYYNNLRDDWYRAQERDYKQEQDAYARDWHQTLFDYQKQQDLLKQEQAAAAAAWQQLMFDYQKQQDALKQAIEREKLAISRAAKK